VSVRLDAAKADAIVKQCAQKEINLRRLAPDALAIALDETVTETDLDDLLGAFGADFGAADVATAGDPATRTSEFMTHPCFHSYRSEHEMLRYLHRLQAKDLSLTTSMIPLGSCTMKLNATSEMLPITWPEIAGIHPFVPAEQVKGYAALTTSLENQLSEITGFAATSLQPNAGSQGEFSGMLVIRAYHESRGEGDRNVTGRTPRARSWPA